MTLEWTTLKRCAGSRYAQLTALVPVIGWLLVVNDEFAHVLAKITGVTQIAQPSWKIYSFHIGLSVFGLGVGLFHLACPRPIKDHEHFNDFCASEIKTITGNRLNDYMSVAGVKSLEEIPESPDVINMPADPIHERNLWLNRNMGKILEVFNEYYKFNNTAKGLPIKWVVVSLFIIGGLLALVPSLATILWSLKRLLPV
jgi:hypothetical protein